MAASSFRRHQSSQGFRRLSRQSPATNVSSYPRERGLYPIQRAHMAVTCACSIRVDRSVDDYVREIGGIEGRLVSKPSYSTRALAPWYTAPVGDGHTGSPVRASLFGLATALAPVAGVYRDREMASDPRSCPLLSSKWDKNPNRRLMSTRTSHDTEWTGSTDMLIGSSSPEPAWLPACTSVLSNSGPPQTSACLPVPGTCANTTFSQAHPEARRHSLPLTICV
ncbi:hypothetical protein HDV62DRAFT_220731 [Trichoderma sp. SZMC 28011]